jgi:Zn-dependent protease
LDQAYIAEILFTASVWVLPILLAITLHEAAHAYVASILGDPTARLLGRVTLNPFAHVDRFGTIILPILLLVLRSPFLIGYAKPVPVDILRLGNPRRDMMLVAAAGPAANLVLAFVAALLLHTVAIVPDIASEWWAANLVRAVQLNLILAVFNLLPIPPLDGGRIMTGLLPDSLAVKYVVLERGGMALIIGLLFLLPFVAGQLGFEFDIFHTVIWGPVMYLGEVIMTLSGH